MNTLALAPTPYRAASLKQVLVQQCAAMVERLAAGRMVQVAWRLDATHPELARSLRRQADALASHR